MNTQNEGSMWDKMRGSLWDKHIKWRGGSLGPLVLLSFQGSAEPLCSLNTCGWWGFFSKTIWKWKLRNSRIQIVNRFYSYLRLFHCDYYFFFVIKKVKTVPWVQTDSFHALKCPCGFMYLDHTCSALHSSSHLHIFLAGQFQELFSSPIKQHVLQEWGKHVWYDGSGLEEWRRGELRPRC